MQNTLREFRGRVTIGNVDIIYNKLNSYFHDPGVGDPYRWLGDFCHIWQSPA